MEDTKYHFQFTNELRDESPHIAISVLGIDGKRINGYIIVDTGCTCNYFTHRIIEQMDEQEVTPLGKQTGVRSINGFTAGNIYNVNFCLGKAKFTEDVSVLDKEDENITDENYFGCLGVNFLKKYELVLDFQDGCVYTAYLSEEEICKSALSYLLTFDLLGPDNYLTPLIYMKDSEMFIPCLLDSGGVSIIPQSLFFLFQNECSFFEDRAHFTETCYETDCDIYSLSCILSGRDTKEIENVPQILEIYNEFDILDEFSTIDRDFTACIGHNIMQEKEMVIDFSTNMIYKFKISRKMQLLLEKFNGHKKYKKRSV